MITLRDVTKSDKSIYDVWQNDSKLASYISRLYPNNCCVEDYDTARVCWFILEAWASSRRSLQPAIEEDTRDIGSVWLEKDTEETDTMVLGIFISGEQFRGKGIGSDSIKEAIRITKQRIAFRNVRLNVRKSNLRAIHCYEKCGFRIYGEGQKTAKDGTIIDYYQMVMKVGD